MTRARPWTSSWAIVKDALAIGVRPRVHLEDITRADFYGFVVPLALELCKLCDESGIPIKIRACDTLGWASPIPAWRCRAACPASPTACGTMAASPASCWSGTDTTTFYRAVVNAGTAWLYGIAAVNCTLLGIGERTGNTPLEAMVFEYAALRGTLDGMDTTVVTEIANYYRSELGYDVPPMTPLVGADFNTTRAGIHADGLLKDKEIYNIFDTDELLGRPVSDDRPDLRRRRAGALDAHPLWPAQGQGRQQARSTPGADPGLDPARVRQLSPDCYQRRGTLISHRAPGPRAERRTALDFRARGKGAEWLTTYSQPPTRWLEGQRVGGIVRASARRDVGRGL